MTMQDNRTLGADLPLLGNTAANGAGTRQKKRTAKSCTACRQSKVRCDLRMKQPCSRCERSSQTCKTDDTFKRIASRNRVRALEEQVEQLTRTRALESPSSRGDGSSSGSVQHLTDTQCSPAEDVSAARSGVAGDWFVPLDSFVPLHLTLFECTVPYQDAVELFTHFARVYHAHCHFLGKVTSLSRLADDSKLLLWTIILIAAQHHERYHHRYLDIRLAHSRLISTTFAEAIQNPLDLQAMLLLCMWPGPVKSQWRDPTGMYLGAAIACARQMGLDKVKDEVFFGTRRAAHQLSKYQSGNLKSTWLKCFELDLQMSLWNGHLPTLAASRYLQSVKDFCRDPSVSRELANTMEIHAQTAQYLLLLDESPSQQMSWSLLTAFVQGVTSTKTANAPSWTPENDLVFHTAEMHICMTSFVRLTHDAASPDSSKDASTAYATEALQRAKECAIRIITSVSTIRKNLLGKATDVLEQSYPLPGCPKHMSYITFYAATVLLKYLDSDLDPSVAQGDARDAFQEAYLFFHSCPISREHFDAGQTLEVAGRAIGRRQAHIRSPVTTRMGSSIIYNVAWLSGLLRGRDTDQEYATGLLRSADILGETESPVAKEAVIETLKGVGPCQTTESMDSSHDWATWDKVYSDGMHFPFGVWDEALYDEWLRTTSEFDLSDWGLLSI